MREPVRAEQLPTGGRGRGGDYGLRYRLRRGRDFPGFVTTRIGQALIAEAMRWLEQSVADAENIDRGVKLAYNYPLGPLELADLIGLDVELHILDSLTSELGERFRPSPVLRRLVAAGRLGRKSGGGFYELEAAHA